ncbi:hypothetical protein EUTSA_v10008832mg [Eutrema salsugineum]|uniref:CRIB domain-containing protein n=1 Tax=Eutrema salsugineum TaxID=72664 RepID=V4KYQ3_EUTSA|nr:CRIB domain-containing protein RIC3 [Eutrema salsugineum]ESQ36479.1 hypothetical protein EUTSA_v10008832mg [Eutrema salsugineum]
MTASVKGFFKGLRYITQIFDEDKDHDMQIGFPTDVKHVAHIGSDGPAANLPSWMSDFKPQENENGQVVTRGDANDTPIGEGVGLQELLPPPEKPKQKKKTRRKSETASQNGSPPRRSSNVSSSDLLPKQSRRHHRSRHGSIDSSNDPSVRRRRVLSVNDMEGPLSDSSAPQRKSTSRHRKVKGSGGGEQSMKKTH